jgi:hypothetical protein
LLICLFCDISRPNNIAIHFITRRQTREAWGTPKINALSGTVEDWTENYFTASSRKDKRVKSDTSLQINVLPLAPDMTVSLISPSYSPFVYLTYFSLLLLVCNRLKDFRDSELSVALIG